MGARHNTVTRRIRVVPKGYGWGFDDDTGYSVSAPAVSGGIGGKGSCLPRVAEATELTGASTCDFSHIETPGRFLL